MEQVFRKFFFSKKKLFSKKNILDAGWPESEEEQEGNVKLGAEVTRRIRIDRQEERQTYSDK